MGVLDSLNTRLKLAPQVRNLLAVLINNDRIGAVHEVVEEYHRELQSRMGIHHAEVTSARELSEADKAKLLARVADLAKGAG